ncbi:type II secretion system protein [Candidatus Azambacteria bacterium]|nr:type II secretion system protein [Candidatus Azambacteria bacterium]
MQNKKSNKGFTLLELLVVISIIAILSVVVVFFIDPVEILKKSRDVQRISDLATMKTAISLYLQDNASNSLGGVTNCSATSPITDNTNKIYVSAYDTVWAYTQKGTGTTTNDGTGWVPVNFSTVTSGAPVSNLPVDPVNTKTNGLYYRYGCLTNNRFELDTALESTAYTSTDNRMVKDGGNSTTRYEVGTDLTVLPATAQ